VKPKVTLLPETPSSTGLSSPRQCSFSPLSTSFSTSDLETVLNKLKAKGLDSDFQKFIELVKNDKFPLDNLLLLLFLETIRFFATSNTSEMHFVAKIHINHLKFQAGVFYIIEKIFCVFVNCDVLVCEAKGDSSSLSFSTIFDITTYNKIIWYSLRKGGSV
jgi:hypothetical protein